MATDWVGTVRGFSSRLWAQGYNDGIDGERSAAAAASTPLINYETLSKLDEKIIDKIGLIAIGIFAFITDSMRFIGSFAVGVFVGNLLGEEKEESKRKSACCSRNEDGGDPAVFVLMDSDQPETARPICGEGYLKRLTGRNFSKKWISIITDLFIVRCLIQHDPNFGVPFCGFTLGIRIGSQGMVVLKDLLPPPSEPQSRRASQAIQPQTG